MAEETPEEKRERVTQQELENNSTGNLQNSMNRGSNGNLVDLVGGLGWKGTGFLILVLIIGGLIFVVFFR